VTKQRNASGEGRGSSQGDTGGYDAQLSWPESLTSRREFVDPAGTRWRRRGKDHLSLRRLSQYLQDRATTVVREYYGEETRILTRDERAVLLGRLIDVGRSKWETFDGVEYRNATRDRLVVVCEGH
jgi:hypothetical protein